MFAILQRDSPNGWQKDQRKALSIDADGRAVDALLRLSRVSARLMTSREG